MLFRVRSAEAFSSFEFFGGAYHQEITESALESVGFSYRSIVLIGEGVVEFDKFYRDSFDRNGRHFVLEHEVDTHDELEASLKDIVERANQCEADYQAYRETLSLVGQHFHTTQDFYAHSNWVERWVSQGVTEVPVADITSKQAIEGLELPYFIASYFPPGENLDPAAYERKFGREFYTSSELDAMSDRGRILETVHPGKAFIHRFMAKDDLDYHQSNLRWEEKGPTLFEVAVDAAVRDTRLRWLQVEARLIETYGARGKRISELLKLGWESNLPASKGVLKASEVKLVSGILHIDEAFDYEVTLVLKPDLWNRSGARAVTALYTDFTTHLETQEHLKRHGIHRLHLAKDHSSKTFILKATLDLKGGAETFLTALPLDSSNLERGDWEVRWKTPKGFPKLDNIKVTTSGGHREWDGKRLLLMAPREGWILPDWIREYLRSPH